MKLGRNQIETLILRSAGWVGLDWESDKSSFPRLQELGLMRLNVRGWPALTRLGQGVVSEALIRLGRPVSRRIKAAAKRHNRRASELLPSGKRLRALMPGCAGVGLVSRTLERSGVAAPQAGRLG